MNRSEVLIYGVFVCSVLMVLGGLAFLLIGALRVQKQQQEDGNALAFEFRGIKLRTDAPAIGIALGGLFFAALAAWMDMNSTMTVHVRGKLTGENVNMADVKVYAAVPLERVDNPGTGIIEDDVTFVLGLDTIYIVPIVPGHLGPKGAQLEPPVPFARLRYVDVGEVPVTAAAISMPLPSATVVTAPTPEPGSDQRKGY